MKKKASKGYTRFINQRNKALNKILDKQSLTITNISDNYFISIKHEIESHFSKITDSIRFTTRGRSAIYVLNYNISVLIDECAKEIVATRKKYSRLSYLLTKASENEALARIKNQSLHLKNVHFKFNHEMIFEKVKLSLEKIQTQLSLEINKAYVQAKDSKWLIEKYISLLPKKGKLTNEVTNVSKKYVEATKVDNRYKNFGIEMGEISDEDWSEILNAYKNEWSPEYRILTDLNGNEHSYDRKYLWEVEQDATNDYIGAVKDGIVESANDAGVTDFIWATMEDEKVRWQHRIRDGLTTTEIEEKLDDEWSDEETYTDRDSIPHPGKYNCRCYPLPYVEDADNLGENNFKTEGFDEWLSTW
jgi:hypothetical protein